ncbi:MAG: pantoate--beta-alanine ligase, partial [Nocardioides sp.]
AALAELDDEAVDLDYLELRTPDLAPVDESAAGPTEARVLVAARLGGTRLIDNLQITLGAPAAPTGDGTVR